jgi:hypothetical protein
MEGASGRSTRGTAGIGYGANLPLLPWESKRQLRMARLLRTAITHDGALA